VIRRKLKSEGTRAVFVDSKSQASQTIKKVKQLILIITDQPHSRCRKWVDYRSTSVGLLIDSILIL